MVTFCGTAVTFDMSAVATEPSASRAMAVVPFSTAALTPAENVAPLIETGMVEFSVQSVAFTPEVDRRKPVAPSRAMSTCVASHVRACVSAPLGDCVYSTIPPLGGVT